MQGMTSPFSRGGDEVEVWILFFSQHPRGAAPAPAGIHDK